MNATIIRQAASIGLALSLALAFVPLGCGSGQALVLDSTNNADAEPTAPYSTVKQLESCALQGVGRLADTHYAIVFDSDVSERGDTREVRVRDTMIHDGGIELCMQKALQSMSVPGAVISMRARQRAAARGVSWESRGQMGNVLVLGGAINLVPILIVAAGVTIVVAVIIHVASDTTTRDPVTDESETQRCKRIKQGCIEYCSDTTLPTPDFGWRFQNCKNECIERQGCPRDS